MPDIATRAAPEQLYRHVLIDIGRTRTVVRGLDPMAENDLYQSAPEPPPTGWNGLRTAGANLMFLLRRLPGASYNDPYQRMLEAQTMDIIASQERPEPGDYERAFPFKVPCRDYQLRIFAAARHMKMIALAPCVMGSGKTKMLLDIAADKFLRDEIDGVCIIASPKGVHRQWINTAIPQHLSDAVPRLCHVWKPTRNIPADVSNANPRRPRYLRVMAFNTEAFSTESGKAFKAASRFLSSGRIMLIMDESSRIKNPRAARTKAIIRLRDFAAVRAIATGTPITKGIENIFTQYQMLDPNIIGLGSYYAFRARYCVTVPAYRGAAFGVVKITGYRNVNELMRKIAPHTFVVPKDALGLPPKVIETREVEMTPAQERLYNATANEEVLALQQMGAAMPKNAAAAVVRLQQILCGRYYETRIDEDGIETAVPRTVESNRIDALIEILQDYDGQAVIWCRFQHDVEDILAALTNLGYPAAAYYGKTSDAEREENKRRFMEGEILYLIGNETMCMGVDGLQCANLAVYYNMSFNAEHEWQKQDRIDRIGLIGVSVHIYLRVPDTVDDLIRRNIAHKENIANSVAAHPALLRRNNRGESNAGEVGELAEPWAA